MITVKPFAALLPSEEYVKECAALPYDVMSSDEAREMVKGKPYSFLHIDKAEICRFCQFSTQRAFATSHISNQKELHCLA